MLRLFDTHAHYNDTRFDEIGGAEKVISEELAAGVVGFINCGTNPASSLESIALAEKYESVYAAVGLHPEDAPDYADRIDETLCEIEALLSHKKVVALGEIGLDYHYESSTRAAQIKLFETMLQLAADNNLPVSFHIRIRFVL